MALLLFSGLALNATTALAANGTLTFTSGIGIVGVVEDGQGGSTDLAGITIQIHNIADTAGTIGGPIEWQDNSFLFSSDTGYSALTFSGGGGTKGMSIKSSDASEFQINSFQYYNWGETESTTITVKGYRDGSEVASMDFEGYDSSSNLTTVALNSSFDNVDEVLLYISAGGYLMDQSATNHSINNIVIADAVLLAPTITSSTYNAATGALVVTGTNFTATAGAINDVVANTFTLTGEGGATYTLTDTSDAEISSATSFTLTLSATDRAGVNVLTNKNGTASTGATSYNLAAAAGFIANSPATADLVANAITVSNVPLPIISSATYNASTGVLTVTGTGFTHRAGATNDIVANKFTLYGEGGNSYTLTDTSNVEIISNTSFAFTLSATDKAAYNLIANKNGGVSTDISTFYLEAADDWAAGADPAINIEDSSGNNITVNNVAIPTITSATYNFSTGVLVVTGTGYLSRQGATNDVVANKFTLTGQAGGTYTLTDTANVEVTSGTSFTLTLSATDKTGVNNVVNQNGLTAQDSTTYNLAAADDWAAGADAALNVADLTGNAITVSNVMTVAGAPTIGTATAGDTQASVTFSAPVSNGGSAITGYTVTSNPGAFTGTGAGSPIVVAGLSNGVAYTFTVTATNGIGTGSASGASNSITPKAAQTITFANPGAQNFGTTPTLSASSDSSLTVTFSSSTTGVCTITSGGDLTFVTAGTCTIDADQAGNGSYLAASTVTQSFSVNAVVPGAPTAATATPGDTQASVAFSAPVFGGGAAITGYTVTASPGGLTGVGAGSPINVTGLTNGVAYTFTVTATNSAGTGSASTASNSIIPKAAQTITFANPGAQNFGTTPTLSATASSSLTPTFSSTTPGVCSITVGGLLNFVAAGSCTIDANQAGNASYLAATTASQTFVVNAVVPAAPIAATATAGDAQATVSFSTPAFAGGAAITGYTVTSTPGGLTGAGASSPIAVTGLTNGVAYSFTVTATNSAGTGAPSAVSNAVTPKATQTITFVNPGVQLVGAPVNLSEKASASSGLTPVFSSSTTSVCTITSGGALTPVAAGTCTITVNQAGNASYAAATAVSRSFTVNDETNRPPVISGTPAEEVTADTAYSFTPDASDADNDTLTFSVVNKPAWASFDTATGALTGTPLSADEGVDGGIVISVSDGVATASLPAFDIEVLVDVDPLQPIVTAPANLEINATGLFTPVTLSQLLGLSPTATQAEVDLALTTLASDGVSGNTCCTTSPQGLANNTVLLAPGRHQIKWKATNAVGVSGEAIQVVDVKPLVSLNKSQIAVRGSNVTFSVILNGNSPTYPLEIPYVIDASSTATAAEHNLVSGVASFTQAGQLDVAIPVSLTSVSGVSDSQLVISLGAGINTGATSRHTMDIRTGNVPPVVSMSLSQGGVNTSLVTPNGGPVTVQVTVKDPNAQDTHSFDWSATSGLPDTDGNPVDASRTFDPSNLTGGHQVQVTVTDSAGSAVSAQAYFRVVASLPVLNKDADTDQDGIGDALEGTGDSDDNGIPDYLDNMPSTNILPQTGSITNSFLLECDPGVRCGLGLFARGSSSGGAQILDSEIGTLDNLVADQEFKPVGGIFDFTIRDLPALGQSVRVVVPQQAPIPTQASYRKFQKGRWVTFIENANNSLASATGSAGYCPPPGASDWTPGLTAGHLCVQLTIEDGGPNDDDGLVNSAVVDPGAVSAPVAVVPPVEPPPVEPPAPAPTHIKSKGSGAINGLWLLLLGSAVFLRRRGARGLTLVLALLGAANTQADTHSDAGQWQLRFDVYQAEGSQTSSEFHSALAADGYAVTLANYEVSRTGYHLAAGYRWNHWTHTELGYLDLGEVEVDLSLAAADTTAGFTDSFRKHYPRTAQGVTLAQGFRYDVNDSLTLSAELGVFMWDEDIELKGANLDLGSDDGIDPLLGVQVGYRLNDSLVLGVTARRIFFSGQEVDVLGVSTTIGF